MAGICGSFAVKTRVNINALEDSSKVMTDHDTMRKTTFLTNSASLFTIFRSSTEKKYTLL